MKVSFGIILKCIIVYLIFIIGLAVLSEWISSRKDTTYEHKIDRILESIKNELKQEYLQKLSQKIEVQPIVQPIGQPTGQPTGQKEQFLNYYPTDTFPPLSEQGILEEASKRIAAQNPYNDTGYSNNINGASLLRTIEHPNESQNFIRQATTSDYAFVNTSMPSDTKPMVFPTRPTYTIDNKVFTPGTGGYVPKKFNVSGYDTSSTNTNYSYYT